MQDFPYNYIKNKYSGKAEILLAHTNSLMYIVEIESVYQDIFKDKKLFDFSNYSKESKYYDNENKLVVGEMEDETCGCL